MSSPFQNFLAVPLHGSSVCHAHTTAFFFAIFRIPILSKSISSIQYNLLFRTAGFLFLRVRRGLNNACARVHYTPRGGVRRSYRRPCRESSPETISTEPERIPDTAQAHTSPYRAGTLHIVQNTAHHAGAPTIAREQPQDASPEQPPHIVPDCIQLIFYHVTISKL